MMPSAQPSWRASGAAISFPLLSGIVFSGCTSIHFENPWAFAFLLPVCLIVYLSARRLPTTMLFSRGDAVEILPITWRIRLRWLPQALSILSIILVIIALARPQSREFEDADVDGIDIMVAFDMSGSMSAVDMPLTEIQAYQRRHGENPPNRFDSAKQTLKRFVDGRSRDRIGMVVFAKDAYLQFPLTLDYATIQTLLDQLRLTSIDPSATAIGNALGLSVRALMDSDATSKTIILITDGKQQGGNISPMHTAEVARDEGIKVFSILVGSGKETLVPVEGLDRKLTRFRPENHPVDPELLQEIAKITGGAAYQATRAEELDIDLNKILDQLDRSRIHDVGNVQATELYMPIAVGAFLMLFLASILQTFWLRRFP